MSEHPYREQPPHAFWSKAVTVDYDPSVVAALSNPAYLRHEDRVVSAGSCFASNIAAWLENADVSYVRTEQLPAVLALWPDNLGYRNFSAAYGNVYTTRHLRQLLERAYGLFTPHEDRWHIDDEVIDPYRPGLRYPATSDLEFDLLTRQHLAAVRQAFETATVLIFTLGLTEAWESVYDGAVFPACPGTVAGTFDPQRHRFINFTAEQVRTDLTEAIRLARMHNPALRVVLTVSPVPIIATATDQHVLVASTYTKCVLRVAAGEVAAAEPDVAYFPAYEMVTGPQARAQYYAEDCRTVTPEGVGTVMTAMMTNSTILHAEVQPAPVRVDNLDLTAAHELSRRVAEAECEEALSDV